jgi:lipid-binding SYLF domain-containing protein
MNSPRKFPLWSDIKVFKDRKGKIMRNCKWVMALLVVLAFGVTNLMNAGSAAAASAAEIEKSVNSATKKLIAKHPWAKELAEKAKGVLVFPNVVKGGFMVGGQYGEGALRKQGKTVAYYNTVTASYGLQAGLQRYGYALFFMTDSALAYLDRSDGWELGTGPSVVIVDKGMAGGMSTTTASSDVYAFFFDQEGLMAGLGLQGTKITRIKK